MFRTTISHFLIGIASLFLAGGLAVECPQAQTFLRAISHPEVPVQKPTTVAIAPTGDLFAITDQFANRILVIDHDANLRWMVGGGTPLDRPIAVTFENDVAVLFSQKGSLTIFRATEDNPERIDTVADLSGYSKHVKSIDRIIRTNDSTYLVLDRSRGEVLRFSADWKLDRVLVENGQDQGQVWEPTDLAIDISGNIIVADAGPFPVQSFSSDGESQFIGGWNSPERNRTWSAQAVAVGPLGIIWIADDAGNQWRLFDRTGTELKRIPFGPQILRPVAAGITAGFRLVVLDDRGSVVMFSLE